MMGNSEPTAMTNNTASKMSHTSFEWQHIRSIFEDLYDKQGLPLRLVMEQLAKDHQFYATPRMFKTKIIEWKLQRNNREHEMLAVIRKSRARTTQGRESRIYIRGKEISLEDVYRYFQRKGISRLDLDSLTIEESRTPSDIKIVTPRKTPDRTNDSNAEEKLDFLHDILSDIAQQQHILGYFEALDQAEEPLLPNTTLTPLHLDKSTTNLLLSVEVYYSTMFRSGQWLLGTIQYEDHSLYPSMTFGSLFLKYHNMRTLRKHDQAIRALDDAFTMVKPLLDRQDPRLLIYFLEALAYCNSVGYVELGGHLIRFFMRMSLTKFGPNYPLTVFAAGLMQAELFELYGVVEVGLQCMINQFRLHIGQEHLETMRLLLTGSTILKHHRNFATAFDFLDQLSVLYDGSYGPESYQSCHALIDKAYLKIEVGQFADAQLLISAAMQRAEPIMDRNEHVESRVRCLVCLAKVRRAQGDLLEMVVNLQLALHVGEGTLDESHWMIRDALAALHAA